MASEIFTPDLARSLGGPEWLRARREAAAAAAARDCDGAAIIRVSQRDRRSSSGAITPDGTSGMATP